MTESFAFPRFRALPPSRSGAAGRWIALAVAAVACAFATGCSTVENALAGDKVDYRSTTVRSAPLDVPPDLSQLSKESRFQTLPGGAISRPDRPAPVRPP